MKRQASTWKKSFTTGGKRGSREANGPYVEEGLPMPCEQTVPKRVDLRKAPKKSPSPRPKETRGKKVCGGPKKHRT